MGSQVIHSMKIKNFKSIGEEEQILDSLGPVNIFIGENNSGKTAGLEILWLFGEIILNEIRSSRGNIEQLIGGIPFNEANFSQKIREIIPNISNFKKFVHMEEGKVELEIAFYVSNFFCERIEAKLKGGNEDLKKKLDDKVKDLNLLKLNFILDFEKYLINIDGINWGNLKLMFYEDITRKKYLHLENYLNVPSYKEEYILGGFYQNNFSKSVISPEIRNFLNRFSSVYYVHSKRTIREIIQIDDTDKGIKGSNLKKVLFDLYHGGPQQTKKYFKILEIFTYITGEKLRQVPLKDGKKVDLVFEIENITVNIDNSGYGFYQVLNLAYNIIMSESNIILIDEPEISLHPQAQIKFFEAIKKIANEEDKQFFISTHSPYFIDLELIDKVYKFTKTNNRSFIARIDNEKLIHRIKEKREGIFHFRHRELFFMKKVIFVEGNNDLDIFSQKLGKEIKEYLYQLGGIDEEKISLFSSFCRNLGIEYAFIVDMDFLVRERNKKAFIGALKKIKQPPKSMKQLLKLLRQENIRHKDKQKAKEIWIKDWNNYWSQRVLQNSFKKYRRNNIFIMPFHDIKILKETEDKNLHPETLNIFSKLEDHLNISSRLLINQEKGQDLLSRAVAVTG